MRVDVATIRQRKRAIRELAAYWCNVLACDRAANAWSLKIILPLTSPAMRLAWKAWLEAINENERERNRWRPGVTKDNSSEVWARAESLLRTGWRPKS